MFLVKTNSKRLIRQSFEGFSVDCLCLFNASFAACPPSCGMLVYNEDTSKETKIQFFGKVPSSCKMLRKCAVSFTYDLCDVEAGLRKKSTNLEIYSVGHQNKCTLS